MSHVRRQLASLGKEATFKTLPTFPPFQDEEYRPASPCAHCFSEDTSDITLLGVADLLLSHNRYIKTKVLTWALQSCLRSVQVHRGELEYLHQLRSPKIFVAKYHCKWDIWILSYLVHSLQNVPIFVNSLPVAPNLLDCFMKCVGTSPCHMIRILFVNMEDSETLLSSILKEKNNDEDIDFIPVSLCYEFLPDDFNLRSTLPIFLKCLHTLQPHVRVNIGLKHSFKNYTGKDKCKIGDFFNHLTYEIWKNTAIMAFHIAAVAQYIPKMKVSLQNIDPWRKSLDEFQMFRKEHDVAFIGHMDDVSRYCLYIASKRPFPLFSKAIDLLKYESIMMKAVLSVIDRNSVDHHMETHKVSHDAVMENFKLLTKILEYEIIHIRPPCTEPSVIEKEALNSLLQKSIISHHSDEFISAESVTAQKMANNLDLEFGENDDEDWVNWTPSQDTPLYVNIKNLLDQQWVCSIASQLVEVYYAAAKQLLVFEKVDVMEDEEFVTSVLQSLRESFFRTDWNSGELREMVHNSLKLFTKLEIIGNYRHSGIKVIYLTNTLSCEGKKLQLIDDIAQFVN